MAINLTKNRDSLLKTWQEVFEDNLDIDWAVFGYDGKTNILKVVETGDGGLQEMQDDLNEGKMLYGVVKVMDPNTNLPKIVFINWQGEGVPSSRKGVCANHVRDVEKFFKGAHVTINARSSDDVEETVVLEKVKKASGANYSFHKEKAKPAEPITPVGSVYQKVKVQQDIDVQKRDDFWSKTEQEEKKRIEQQRRQAIAEKNEAERKRKEREAKEAEQRDIAYRERSRSIDQQKRKAREIEEKKKQEERKRWEDQQVKEEREMQEEKKRANSLRQARLKEAEQLIHQGQQEKPKFKELTRPASPPIKKKPPPRRPPPQVHQPQPEPEPEPTPEPEVEREPTPKPEPAAAQPTPEPQEEPKELYENLESAPYDDAEPNEYNIPDQDAYEQIDELNKEPDQHVKQVDDAYEQVDDTYEQVDDTYEQVASNDTTEPEPVADEELYHNVADPQDAQAPLSAPGEGGTQSARALFDYQAENEEEISFDPGDIITEIDQFDEGWWKGRGPRGRYGMFPANFVELLSESSETTAEPTLTKEDRGLQARALYDYQATDDTEITFDPGDLITNIEQIDDGWWRGEGPDGRVGLFPANYVELVA